jgi:Protein of unknown function (DUF3606)
MADDKKHKGTPDPNKISTSEAYEVEYWSKKFGVTSQQLKDAVKKVGNSPAKVQKELSK